MTTQSVFGIILYMTNTNRPAAKTTAAALLVANIAALATPQILEALTAIGGGHVETDVRMVRAFLIEEYITREGVAAGDALMDGMGL